MPEGKSGQPENSARQMPPGSGRRNSPFAPKGRGVEPEALQEVRALLGDAQRRRDLLIEFLHRLQERYGHLSARHLAALAEEMRLPMAAVYETASFYAHFDIVAERERPPPAVTLRVCDSLSCAMAGAEDLLARLKQRFEPEVRVVRAPCMGRCDRAPTVAMGEVAIDKATGERVAAALEGGSRRAEIPRYRDLAAYRAEGGYRLLEAARAGRLERESLFKKLEDSGLRGLGGAGFRAGLKWRILARQPKPRLLAVNADEGEPGTFKDRFFLERDPHRMLEGMLIAAWATECEAAYIYLRDEYPAIRHLLAREIAALATSGLAGGVAIELRRGAGAYICGEESAMLESLEGKRGYPRHKPPYPTEHGLFGRPTLAHNVETLHWVRDILEKGDDWWRSHGRHGRTGLRSFSVSGRVRDPGVKIAPAGITALELIEEYCGGMEEGHVFRAYLPGGASGGILPASLGDVPLDFDTLQPHGCFIGSAAIVVLSQQDDLKAAALNLLRFFEDESCGQCTPCRNGTEKAVALMSRPKWDLPLLAELSTVMMESSICGLGQAAPNPLLSLMKHFPEELK